MVLEWRGLRVTQYLLLITAAFWLSLVVMIGCFVVILSANNTETTTAAISIVTTVITAWITTYARNRG